MSDPDIPKIFGNAWANSWYSLQFFQSTMHLYGKMKKMVYRFYPPSTSNTATKAKHNAPKKDNTLKNIKYCFLLLRR